MIARLLITAGAALVVLGVIFPLFGHLPGDMAFTRGPVRFYIPLGSCLLFSVYISIVLIGGSWFLSR